MKQGIYKACTCEAGLLTYVLHSNNSINNKTIYLQTIYLQIIYTKKDLVLNNPQGLICH